MQTLPGSNLKSVTIGGRTFGPQDISNESNGTTAGYITLGATHLSINNYSPLIYNGQTTGFQVPSGMTLTIYAAQIYAANGSTVNAAVAQLLYGDFASAVDTATIPTTPIYLFGRSDFYLPGGNITTQNGDQSSFIFKVPALKYPASKNSPAVAAMRCIFHGILA